MKQVSDCCGADVKEHSINGVDHNNNDTFGDWHECLECSKPCTPITPMSEAEKYVNSIPRNKLSRDSFGNVYNGISMKEIAEIASGFALHLLNSISEVDKSQIKNNAYKLPLETLEDAVIEATIETLKNKLNQ